MFAVPIDNVLLMSLRDGLFELHQRRQFPFLSVNNITLERKLVIVHTRKNLVLVRKFFISNTRKDKVLLCKVNIALRTGGK